MFEPQPIKVIKRGKRPFQIVLVIFWLLVIMISIWGAKTQFNSPTDFSTHNKNDLLPVQNAQGREQVPKDQPRVDEFLGSKIFNEITDNPEKTGNPMSAPSSLEGLLKGQEVIVP